MNTRSTLSLPDLQALAAVVVKDGVALGGLADEARALVLGFAWAGLPRTVMSEAGVNAVLKQQLAGALRCLHTDHVELRRWLCDSTWLQRDGYGGAYRRQPPELLPPHLQALGQALEAAFDTSDTAAYTEARRAARQAEREARRRAHEAAGPQAA
jgi:hypothetical protein